MRLANLDNGVFERLGRYEAALWRQIVQTLFAPNRCGTDKSGWDSLLSPRRKSPPGEQALRGLRCQCPQSLEIHGLRAVRPLHAPQSAFGRRVPKDEHSDSVALDQFGQLRNRANHREIAQSAALLANDKIAIGRVVVGQFDRADHNDCPDCRNHWTRHAASLIGSILPGNIVPAVVAIPAMDLKRAMAANVRRLRTARKLTQEELADRAGISVRYLGSIERGSTAATIVVLGRLARALRAAPCELLESRVRPVGGIG